MENKYFTPSMEEFFEGYEFEYKNNMQSNEFELTIFDASMSGIMYNDYEHENNEYLENHYRTPFLTKEQIEQVGWTHHYDDFTFGVFWKEIDENWDYSLEYDYTYHRLLITIISKDDMKILSTKFSGECKSINELRTIFKFLKIK